MSTSSLHASTDSIDDDHNSVRAATTTVLLLTMSFTLIVFIEFIWTDSFCQVNKHVSVSLAYFSILLPLYALVIVFQLLLTFCDILVKML